MNDGGLGSIVFLLLLILLHGLVALAYAALTNSRQSLLRDQIESDTDAPPRLHITYQLSLILIQFTIATVAITTVGQSLAGRLSANMQDFEADLARAAACILVLLPTAFFTLVLGDLVPGAVGTTSADRIAPSAMPLMRGLIILLSPIVTLMIALSQVLASAFGSDKMVNTYTEEEIMTLLDAGEKEGTIENEEKEMIYSVLQFGEKLVREVMVPRIDMVAMDIETPLDEALAAFVDNGHSRIPVYEDSIDNIKGLLYAKDMLNVLRSQPRSSKPISEIMRKAFFVPESKRADILLKELKAGKIHMAIVVDEYGGTAGMVTIEDLIEEIIGDIQDEYDLHEEADFVQHNPNEYTVDASMNLSDFNNMLEVELPTEDNDTLGGFIFTQLGHVPEVGERVEYHNLLLRIEAIDGRRIRKVHVTRRTPPPENTAENVNNSDPKTHPQTVTE